MLSVWSVQAQPSDKVIFELANTFEWLPNQQTDVAVLHDGKDIGIEQGSFIRADRQEYLITLGLALKDKTEKLAFIVYEELGTWQRSDWFKMRFTNLEIVDVDLDGLHELVHEVSMDGKRMDQYTWRLIRLTVDEEEVLHKAEGFHVHTNRIPQESLNPGDHIARRMMVRLVPAGKNGYLAIEESIDDRYFGINDLDGDGAFHSARQTILPEPELTVRMYTMNKHGIYELSETRDQKEE